MTELLLTDDELDLHRTVSKHVRDPGVPWKRKRGGHGQRSYTAESEDGAEYLIYLRQNDDDQVDFSCGLALILPGRRPLSLVRYNGSSHRHGEIAYRSHIHLATAQALLDGKRADSFAEQTNRYDTLEAAFRCLIHDCSVRGLDEHHDQMELFDGT